LEDYLLSVADTAKRLGVASNRNFVYELIEKGLLRAVKLKSLKIRNSEINRFLEWAEDKDLSDLNNIKSLN
jgi:excisionase family DNA binding protein